MPVLRPDQYLTSVRALDFQALRSSGVDSLLLDLDNTLLPRDGSGIPDDILEWLGDAHEAGFALCLVSNNWHAHVRDIAADLGLPIVAKALKPFPFAFRRAIRLLGTEARRCAVVGDQLFTDVIGGKLIGATTVLVRPLSRRDLPHTLALRLVESAIMADREPEA
jgi:hypothetical protein